MALGRLLTLTLTLRFRIFDIFGAGMPHGSRGFGFSFKGLEVRGFCGEGDSRDLGRTVRGRVWGLEFQCWRHGIERKKNISSHDPEGSPKGK